MTTSHATPPATTSAPRASLVSTGLVGGIGGLVFVASVIAQNGLRVSAPANDAGARTVIDYYDAHHGAAVALAILFAIGAIGLAAFVGSLASRLVRGPERGPALVGLLGVAGIFGLYSMLLASDLGLSAYVDRGGAAPEVVSALWVGHNAVFGVLLVAIAIALVGLSTAAATAGLVAPAWKQVGLVGALLLAITGGATPAVIDGSPIVVAGLLGFATWIAFVIVAAVALLRSRGSSPAS